jgi:hypothetical protein
MRIYIINNESQICVLKKDLTIYRDFIKKNSEFFSLVVSCILVDQDQYDKKLYNNKQLIAWISGMMKSKIAQFNKLSPSSKLEAFIASKQFEEDQAKGLKQILTLLETEILDYFLEFNPKIQKLDRIDEPFLYCDFELQEEAELFIRSNHLRLI